MRVFAQRLPKEEEPFTLEVTPSLRVENVKCRIHKLDKSLPTCKQLLVYGGQQLQDGYSLEEYGIENDSTIFIVFNPAGDYCIVSIG